MKKSILIFYCMLLMLYSFSQQQPCNDEVIMNTKGSWKKVSDANQFPDPSFPKNQYPQATTRIDKMQKLLQAAYPEPKGIEASWHRNISGNPEVKAGPVPYELYAQFRIFFCNYEKNGYEVNPERGADFFVWANHFNWFAKYIKYYIIQKQPVYLLNKKIGAFNGYPLYEGILNRTENYNGSAYSRAIIITRTGQSPYVPVTQKQFLKAFLNYNGKRFVKDLAFETNRTVKTDAQEKEAKKGGLEYYTKGYTADVAERRKANYLKNYQTEKQRNEANIARMKKTYEDDMKPARDLLADSLKADLEQPAILDFDNLLTFKEFTTEEKGGQQLVRLNPDYFNMTLPKYVPQLLIVYWGWDDAKAANIWRAQVEKNFNFNALKEMIDK
jgi:hypothetical protein